MNSDETAIASTTGSAACAQQPQLAQVGGQLPSALPWASELRHGSPMIIVDAPDALSVNTATTRVSRHLRTGLFYNLRPDP